MTMEKLKTAEGGEETEMGTEVEERKSHKARKRMRTGGQKSEKESDRGDGNLCTHLQVS